MKRITAILIVLLIIASVGMTAFASAGEDDSYIVGDSDRDGEVTILDATLIQRYLADLAEEDEIDLTYAETDGDLEVTILDATAIQRWLAGFDDATDIGKRVSDQDALRREIEEKIADYTVQKGIDVSTHNGNVDMNKVKAAGFSFVMIRLGYGDDLTKQDDARFEENVRKAEAAGLDWGAYIYSYALSVDEAESEIQHTLRLLKGKKPTMPIAFDMEPDSYKDRMGLPSDATLRQICITYLEGIKNAGYYPILYANLNWIKTKLNGPELLSNYDIWVAQWNSTLSYQTDNVGMWQYGGEVNYIDGTTIDGISGVFDKNYCFRNYPVIITAYGYNNHTPLIGGGFAATGSDDPDPQYTPKAVPDGYDGVMGDSMRNRN